MKKNIILFLIIGLIITIGSVGFILYNNQQITIITLDINPSIEIKIDKKEIIKDIKALNEDANDIISNSLVGKNFDDAMRVISDKLIEKDYNHDLLEIIMYVKGNLNGNAVKEKIDNVFSEKHIDSNIVVIDKITKEDEKLANEYNISVSKAAYINEILKRNENIKIDNLFDKSIKELNETKNTGNYCEQGYILEGDWCKKEIDEKPAKSGLVCPQGYVDYNDKCYEEIGSQETNNLVCREEFTLEGSECVRKTVVDAVVKEYKCPTGEVKTKGEVGISVIGSGEAREPVCVDPSSKTHPVTVCELPASDPTERMSYGGKCYWHRAPVIEEGCPGKIQVNGFCWDIADNIYLCPNGNNSNTRSKDDYCYKVLNNVKPVPSVYSCDDDMTLNGKKCVKEEKEPAEHERVCPSGYKLVNYDRCINDKTTNKENGFICEYENSELRDNICIIYEFVEVKHN